MPLWPLLEQIARQAGWNVFVEPDTTRAASAKFKDLPSGEALKRLLGDLNFALVPQSNALPHLYVFRTTQKNATQPVPPPRTSPRYVPNELLVKLKPGADVDALAKSLGAKITGRNDNLGLYRLLFDKASATDSALGQLKNNSDVAEVDYNYVYDAPPPAQALPGASASPLSLTLNPPGDSGKVIVGLIDTPVQSLGSTLDKFLLKQVSVAGDTTMSASDPTHGTTMAYTILQAIAQQSPGGTSVQILPVDVYGSGANATTWNVALGIQQAVDAGATVLNLSLAGPNDSPMLANLLQQAVKAGIPVYAAAGNQPVTAPMYPAADSGVISVTALQQPGQLAPYANFGLWIQLALPGGSVVVFNGQAWGVQGTSVATAYATGIFAGVRSGTSAGWQQIVAAMQRQWTVPGR
ncbi:MAG TPA: S8 family serine peptidase [Candidatus Acidoferrum sp.]|nr:S8 family serine peptidase [Candidatus Acidoferrum sp.]